MFGSLYFIFRYDALSVWENLISAPDMRFYDFTKIKQDSNSKIQGNFGLHIYKKKLDLFHQMCIFPYFYKYVLCI